MAQIAWQVRGNRGVTFALGLFHGDKTGHVMLYCNNQIVQLDFSVQQSKTYTLFLDEELCNIHITRAEDGTFSYRCELDQEADTPLNKARKISTDKPTDYFWRSIIGVFVFLLLLLLLIAVMA